MELIYPVSHWLNLVQDLLKKEIYEIERNQTHNVFIANSLLTKKIKKLLQKKEFAMNHEVIESPPQGALESPVDLEKKKTELQTILSSIVTL